MHRLINDLNNLGGFKEMEKARTSKSSAKVVFVMAAALVFAALQASAAFATVASVHGFDSGNSVAHHTFTPSVGPDCFAQIQVVSFNKSGWVTAVLEKGNTTTWQTQKVDAIIWPQMKMFFAPAGYHISSVRVTVPGEHGATSFFRRC